MTALEEAARAYREAAAAARQAEKTEELVKSLVKKYQDKKLDAWSAESRAASNLVQAATTI